MNWRLDGKKVLISGASKGIGAAIAASALERGADVWLVARGAQQLHAYQQQLQQRYPQQQICASVADLSDATQRQQLLEKLGEQWSGLHVLINNLGSNVRKRALDFSLHEYHQLMDLNLTSALHLSQLCHPLLQSSAAAAIVNIASVAGLCHLRTGVVYAMSKAAMLQMTRNLAVEWAEDGIRVNSIAPWYTDTPLAQQVLSDADYRDEVLARTPMGRIASSREVADAAVFLALPAAGFITGVCLPVDGGMSILGF
ncbi:MAG: SDR family oxidoreductase [Gammaproteobacteria bacterium]|nr:SDR family oxidoreductase [Gammaproteobacteria bacterium]